MVNKVYYHVPNLIGYIRIILGMIAFYDYNNMQKFSILYTISFILDAADGYAARLLHQSSKLGAYLDMITDRVATAALLATVIKILTDFQSSAPSTKRYDLNHPSLNPDFHPEFLYAAICVVLLLVLLDGVSHWTQMLVGIVNQAESHKQASQSRLLQLYYWRPVLTLVCIFNELFFFMLYVLIQQSRYENRYAHTMPHYNKWTSWMFPNWFVWFWLLFSLPVCLLKQVISFQQIIAGHGMLFNVAKIQH